MGAAGLTVGRDVVPLLCGPGRAAQASAPRWLRSHPWPPPTPTNDTLTTRATGDLRRLIARHLETWNDEKSARWGPGEVGAAARADANDVLNMELIAKCADHADLIIESE